MKRRTVVAISTLLTILSGGAAIWVAVTGHGLAYYFGDEFVDTEEVVDKDPSEFVKVGPMQLVVRGQNGRNYRVMLNMNLEMVDPKNKLKVHKMLPRLRDAYVRELFGIPMAVNGEWRADELEGVKARLLDQSNNVMGSQMIANIVIQQAVAIPDPR
jgi:hypothetical protein